MRKALMQGIFVGVLITGILLGQDAFAQAFCVPSTTPPVTTCINQPCNSIGASFLDGDGVNIVACLRTAPLAATYIWKGITSSGGGASSLSSNGYETLPDGLILQWGTYTGIGRYSGDPGYIIPLPIPFPNGCFNVTTSLTDRHPTNGDKQWDWGITCSNTTLTLNYYFESNGGNPTFRWFAIGH